MPKSTQRLVRSVNAWRAFVGMGPANGLAKGKKEIRRPKCLSKLTVAN